MKRVLTILPQVIVLIIAGAACWMLTQQLRTHNFANIRLRLSEIPASRLWLAGGLTIVNYFVLIGYDYLAVRSIGHPLPLKRIGLGSFIGFAVSYTVGALFGGTAVRYRLYSSWGLSTVEIVRLIVVMGTTFWLGVFALASVMFIADPFPLPPDLHLPFTTVEPIGWISLSIVATYFAIAVLWKKPFRYKGQSVKLPSVGMSMLQMGVAALDFVLAAACLHLLIPGESPHGPIKFLALYVLGWIAVVFTHAPGGVGVLDCTILAFTVEDRRDSIAAALVVFRVIYYLLPFLVAIALFVWHETLISGSPLNRFFRKTAMPVEAANPDVSDKSEPQGASRG